MAVVDRVKGTGIERTRHRLSTFLSAQLCHRARAAWYTMGRLNEWDDSITLQHMNKSVAQMTKPLRCSGFWQETSKDLIAQ